MTINYKYIITIALTIGVTLLVCNLLNNKSVVNYNSLTDSLRVREKKILLLDSISKVLAVEKINSTNIINRLTHNTDSLNRIILLNDSKIKNSQTKIINLANQYNEKINSINNWNSNNYNSFFTEYFKSKK